MKSLFISDLLKSNSSEKKIELYCWIKGCRPQKNIIFVDFVDSTGTIQGILTKNNKTIGLFKKVKALKPESSVLVYGNLRTTKKRNEIIIKEVDIVGDVKTNVFPRPRSDFDILNDKYINLVLGKRHLYLRNPKLMAIIKFRHKFFKIVHQWFDDDNFVEIHTPVLTKIPLYESKTAFNLNFFGKKIFLTQCSAFYLESQMFAFEKVYNLGPSFRAEESKSRRHLSEYWHLKAEVAFCSLDEMMSFVEKMISHIIKGVSKDCKEEFDVLGVKLDPSVLSHLPYPRISYEQSVLKLEKMGMKLKRGQSLGNDELEILSKKFKTPFWITGLPAKVEPFPYPLDPVNKKYTKTADLIAPGANGGELLGVAEKIYSSKELLNNMRAKGKKLSDGYSWYYELRLLGSVPHSGMGMGVERTIRWLLDIKHVRDVIPFPRIFRRNPYP